MLYRSWSETCFLIACASPWISINNYFKWFVNSRIRDIFTDEGRYVESCFNTLKKKNTFTCSKVYTLENWISFWKFRSLNENFGFRGSSAWKLKFHLWKSESTGSSEYVLRTQVLRKYIFSIQLTISSLFVSSEEKLTSKRIYRNYYLDVTSVKCWQIFLFCISNLTFKLSFSIRINEYPWRRFGGKISIIFFSLRETVKDDPFSYCFGDKVHVHVSWLKVCIWAPACCLSFT